MNATEFVYWLRGFFELSSAADSDGAGFLNGEQVNMIRSHIALVKRCDWERPVEDTHHFVSWLSGFLDRRSEGVADVELSELGDALYALFQHETSSEDAEESDAPSPSGKDPVQEALDRIRPLTTYVPALPHRSSRGRLIC